MTTSNKKIYKAYARDMLALQKQFLADDIAESSNAMAYAKFLDRTMTQLKTFDRRSPDTYVDYVARDMQRQQKGAEKRANRKLEKNNAIEESTGIVHETKKEKTKNKKKKGPAAVDLLPAQKDQLPAKEKKRKEGPVDLGTAGPSTPTTKKAKKVAS